MKSKKNFLVLIILFVLVCLGIGYAYLTTTLSINGVTDVDSNSWDVHFANVQVITGSVSGSLVTQVPTISNDTSISYHIRLAEPGDFYEFNVDAVNAGTIDAMIGEIHSTLNGVEIINLPTYLRYTLTYSDGVVVENNHLLASNTIETYKVKIEYRSDIDPDDLPSSLQSLSLGFEIEYIQATNSASSVRNYLYSSYQAYMVDAKIDSPIPELFTYYDSQQQALNAWNYNFFLRFNMKNDNIHTSDVGFVIGDNVYYLIGSNLRLTSDEINGIYSKNRDTLLQAFGSNNCNSYDFGVECDNGTIRAFSYNDHGNIFVGNNTSGIYCEVLMRSSYSGDYYVPYCGSDNI